MTSPRVKATPSRWVKVAVDYYRNPKIISVGIFGEVAFLRLLAIARERIEMSEKDGEVPLVLAQREIRDVAEAWGQGGVDDLLTLLVNHELITLDEETILIEGYGKWQTTRDEIATTRKATRSRVAAARATKK